MKNSLVFSTIILALLSQLSLAAQKPIVSQEYLNSNEPIVSHECLECQSDSINAKKEFIKKACPKEVQTILYLDRCNTCGFPVTQRKYKNCKE